MNHPDYPLLARQAFELIEGVPHLTANLANLSALLYDAMDDVNWLGFYLLQGDKLVLGPFQGKPACVEIPVGRGVCGTAVQKNEALLVPDVHLFPGHIACDSASRSELVLPLRSEDGVFGVLDIDSPHPARFTPQDQEGLEALVRKIEPLLRQASQM